MPVKTKKKTVKTMSLKEWIKAEGNVAVEKMLKVHDSTVRHWQRGWTIPHRLTLQKIEKLTKGAVTIERMIVDHYSKANRKNRYAAADYRTK